MYNTITTTWRAVLPSSATTVPRASVRTNARFLEPRSFGEPWIIIERQLTTGDGFFKFGLFIGYTTRSWKPFLSLGYPSFDVFRRVQGYVGSLDDDGLSGERLGLVAAKEGR